MQINVKLSPDVLDWVMAHDRRCAAAAGVLYQCRHDTAGLGVVAL